MLKILTRLISAAALLALSVPAWASESTLRCEFGGFQQDQFISIGRVEIPFVGGVPSGSGKMTISSLASGTAADAEVVLSVKADTPKEGETYRFLLTEPNQPSNEVVTLVVKKAESKIGAEFKAADMISSTGDTYEAQGITSGCKLAN